MSGNNNNFQMNKINRLNFIGLSVSSFSIQALVDAIQNIVYSETCNVLYGYSLWTIVNLKTLPEVYEYGEQSDLLVADGRPFYLLTRLHGLPVQYEISIPNLVLLCLDLANKNGWKIFVFGAEEYVNQQAQVNLKQKYSNLSSVGGIDGFFEVNQLENIKKEIAEFNPDILLIGLPSPLKEQIAIEWRNESIARIIIPCGGMIDVLGGKTKLTPKIIKKLGLASFYRFIQEPKRLFKKTLLLYFDVFFKFLPLYTWEVFIKRNKNFNLPDYYFNKKCQKDRM